MEQNKKLKIEAIAVLILVISLFIIVSYFVQKNLDIVKPFIFRYSFWGIGIYIAFLAL